MMAEDIKIAPELSPEDLQPDICSNPYPLSWDRSKLNDQVGEPGWRNKFNWYMVMQVCLSVFYAIIYGISFTGLHPYYEWPPQLKNISDDSILCPSVKQITLESILTNAESFKCKNTTFFLNETGPLFNCTLEEHFNALSCDPDALYFDNNCVVSTTDSKTIIATPVKPHENITEVCRTAYDEISSFRECIEICSPGACCLPSSANNSCRDDNMETCQLYSPCEILRNYSNLSGTISLPDTSYGSLTKICSKTDIYNISNDDCWKVCSSAVCCFSSLVDSCLADNLETCKWYAPCEILIQGNRKTQISSNTSSAETYPSPGITTNGMVSDVSLENAIDEAFENLGETLSNVMKNLSYHSFTKIDFESSTYNLLVNMGSYWGISIAYFVVFIVLRLFSGKYNQMILLVQFDEDEQSENVKPAKLSVAYTIMCNAKSFSNIVFKDLCKFCRW
jgi:hypothetical protein